jgi:hypothetical protein
VRLENRQREAISVRCRIAAGPGTGRLFAHAQEKIEKFAALVRAQSSQRIGPIITPR